MEYTTLKSGSLLKYGEYRIISTLGQGGFGITYEAEQVSLGRKVAVKEFFMKDICNRDENTSQVSVPSIGSKELVEKFRQKFLKEARMLAGLDHEYIVKIIDVFEENGTAYYVMEYLVGGSLDRKIKDKGALPEAEAIGFIRQIASALEYLHSQNILHFDIKPSNVLLGKNGSAKLIDFGISKHYDEAGAQTSSTPVGISKGYAPLEQYQQGSDIKSFNPATDIYSLGATLYAILTGSNPPEASIVNEDGVPAIDGISPKVKHAIEKAMQPRRKDRPQSVGEFLALLDSEVEEDNEKTVVPEAEAKAKKPKSGKEKKPAESEKPKKQQKQKELTASEKKPFPTWLIGTIVGVAVAVAAVLLWPKIESPGGGDNPLVDSTAVVLADNRTDTSVSGPVPSAMLTTPKTPATVELQSISLSKTTLTLEEGEVASLSVKYTPNNATDKTAMWKSSDSSVAKVNTNGKVTAIKVGSAAIIATCQGKDAYCNVTVKAKPAVQPAATVTQPASSAAQPAAQVTQSAVQPTQPTTQSTTQPASNQTVQPQSSSASGRENGHEWVDLGLSVKWATCNVGASRPSDYGSYFAWGETKPKSDYSWSTLKYCLDSDGNKFSKYVTENSYGSVDAKRTLETTDDAARVNWGGKWRMPTRNELMELKDKCTWTWTTLNGHKGYNVTSKINGNSIFLPAAGYCSDDNLTNAGSSGRYWSSSLNTDDPYNACSMGFNSGYMCTDYYNRYFGRSVRPVSE